MKLIIKENLHLIYKNDKNNESLRRLNLLIFKFFKKMLIDILSKKEKFIFLEYERNEKLKQIEGINFNLIDNKIYKKIYSKYFKKNILLLYENDPIFTKIKTQFNFLIDNNIITNEEKEDINIIINDYIKIICEIYFNLFYNNTLLDESPIVFLKNKYLFVFKLLNEKINRLTIENNKINKNNKKIKVLENLKNKKYIGLYIGNLILIGNYLKNIIINKIFSFFVINKSDLINKNLNKKGKFFLDIKIGNEVKIGNEIIFFDKKYLLDNNEEEIFSNILDDLYDEKNDKLNIFMDYNMFNTIFISIKNKKNNNKQTISKYIYLSLNEKIGMHFLLNRKNLKKISNYIEEESKNTGNNQIVQDFIEKLEKFNLYHFIKY